jgi:hypothetical protein
MSVLKSEAARREAGRENKGDCCGAGAGHPGTATAAELARRGYSESTVLWRKRSGEVVLIDFNPGAVRRAAIECQITGNRAQRRKLRATLYGSPSPARLQKAQPLHTTCKQHSALSARQCAAGKLTVIAADHAYAALPPPPTVVRGLMPAQNVVTPPSAMPP